MNNKFILASMLVLVFYMSSALAYFTINGTMYDLNGNALNATNITVIVKDTDFTTQLASNTTLSNASGWFELNVSQGAIYLTTITHRNATTNQVDYVGQSLPPLPHAEFSGFTNISFYLYDGATINVTVINSTGSRLNDSDFAFQIKDKKLGYPITCYDTVANDNDSICQVPKDRNYSIMIYPATGSPHNFVPVSFEWNNFTQTADESFGLSSYNGTLKILHKQFNVTESFARLTGYVNYTGINGWDTITIVPYIFDPGNMIHMSVGGLPFNTSSWDPNSDSDIYNLSSGWFNISLPYAQQETVKYMLIATARNTTGSTSKNYGAYYNLTVSGNVQVNFTLYGLLGVDTFINQSSSTGGNAHLVNVSELTFQFTNASGNLSNINGHVEIKVDYSAYNSTEFTFIEDLSGANSGNFNLPLLNVTGIKEINVYSNDYAPRSVTTKSAAQLGSFFEINLTTFSPNDISGSLSRNQININLYRSNSTCDVPTPPAKCSLIDSSSTLDQVDMFKTVLGGGKISFRMGLSTGIKIHYVNVDLLASGPPDGLFDSSTSESATSDSFSSALTFGSKGPTIYDYILISMPYTEGSTSRTGLNENEDLNISIPTFYDENWNVIWNTATNGTNGTALAANYSHYSTYSSAWQTLMSPTNCSTNVSWLNLSNPCYLDTTNNNIWVRLPHFSGTEPTVTGDGITATATTTSSSSSSSSSSGGGGSAVEQVSGEYSKQIWEVIEAGETTAIQVENGEIGVTEVSFKISDKVYGAWIKVAKVENFPSNIPQPESAYKLIEITRNTVVMKEDNIKEAKIAFKVKKSWLEEQNSKKEDIAMFRYNEKTWKELPTILGEDDGAYIHYTSETPGFSYFAIAKKVAETTEKGIATAEEAAADAQAATKTQIAEEGNATWLVLLVVLIVLSVILYFCLKKKTPKHK